MIMPVTTEGVGWKSQDTSRAAAKKVRPKPIKAQILTAMEMTEGQPVSPDVIAKFLGRSILSVRPRFSELAHDGAIVDSGKRGKTDEGGGCILWRLKGEA